AKKGVCLAGIAEQGSGTFGVRRKQYRFNSKVAAKFYREITYRKSFGPGDVQYEGRRLTVRERAQAPGVSVQLPDHIYKRHAQRNGTAFEHRSSNIHQNSIAQLDGIVQAQDRYSRPPSHRPILEHALTAERRLRIFSDGADRRRLHRSTLRRGTQRINVA